VWKFPVERLQSPQVDLHPRTWKKDGQVGKEPTWKRAEKVAQSEREARDPVKIELKKIAEGEEAKRKTE